MEDYTAEEAFDEICNYFIYPNITDPKYKKTNSTYYKNRVDLIKQTAEDEIAISYKITRIAAYACIVLGILCAILTAALIITNMK